MLRTEAPSIIKRSIQRHVLICVFKEKPKPALLLLPQALDGPSAGCQTLANPVIRFQGIDHLGGFLYGVFRTSAWRVKGSFSL